MWCKSTGIQNDLARMTLPHQEAIKLYYCSAPLYWRSAYHRCQSARRTCLQETNQSLHQAPSGGFSRQKTWASVQKKKKKSLAISSSGHSSTDEAVKSLSFTGPPPFEELQTAQRLSRLQTGRVSGFGWKFPLKWEEEQICPFSVQRRRFTSRDGPPLVHGVMMPPASEIFHTRLPRLKKERNTLSWAKATYEPVWLERKPVREKKRKRKEARYKS